MTDDEIRWVLGGLGAEHVVVEDAKARHAHLLADAEAVVAAWEDRTETDCTCREDAGEPPHDHPDRDEQLETAQSTLRSVQIATQMVSDHAEGLEQRAADAKEQALRQGVFFL